jgi:glucose-1-phosphatase
MPELKNIIFDLGAVLIDIDYKKTENAFVALGFENFSVMYSQFNADATFEKLETGRISNEDFYNKLISLINNTITTTQIKNAWNEIILNWRGESLNFLETLSQKFKLFLLSNTNAIHYEYFMNSLKSETNRIEIDSLFTKAYYSHKIHLRKPNANIFEFVVLDSKINIENTLFIDDSSNNIETAKKLGFKTHLLLEGERIENLHYDRY